MAKKGTRGVAMLEPERRLLVMGCSQRKRPDLDPLPALDRYDGPPFRVLRRYLRSDPANPPLTLILSAKYGLIPASLAIPNYDEILGDEGLRKLRAQVRGAAMKVLTAHQFNDVLLVASARYLQLLAPVFANRQFGCEVKVAPSGNGPPLTCLSQWLRREIPLKHKPRIFAGV